MSLRGSDKFRREMGADMLAGGHYDMTEQTSTVTTTIINGSVICQPGEEVNGFKNPFAVPIKLTIRDGKIQRYEGVYK